MSDKQIVRDGLENAKELLAGTNVKNSPRVDAALTALENLYDKAAHIEKIEGMRWDRSSHVDAGIFNAKVDTRDNLIDAVIKLIKGEER